MEHPCSERILIFIIKCRSLLLINVLFLNVDFYYWIKKIRILQQDGCSSSVVEHPWSERILIFIIKCRSLLLMNVLFLNVDLYYWIKKIRILLQDGCSSSVVEHRCSGRMLTSWRIIPSTRNLSTVCIIALWSGRATPAPRLTTLRSSSTSTFSWPGPSTSSIMFMKSELC